MKTNIISLLLFFIQFTLSAQEPEENSLKAIQDSLYNQFSVYPQEKIHLHTDRNMYISGEKIWFKAYIADALTHRSPTYSRYVYVELINSSDSLINRVMIRRGDDGMYYGHLFLSEILPEGAYTICAYTRYLQNIGDDYYFKKNIWIGNLPAETEKNRDRREKRRKVRDDYDVSLLPEGGNLLEGTFSRVAFKAVNKNGSPEYITGEIIDEEERQMCSVKTFYAGMGYFAFIPEKGKKYFLKSKNRDGLEKKFELPFSRNTYSITTSTRNHTHYVSVKKSVDCPEKPLFLFAHSQGLVFYYSLWDHTKEYIVFSKDRFPSGIIQFILFDQEMNPLSERLIFNKNEGQAAVVFATDRPGYEKREKVTSAIYLKDSENNPLPGNVSVAVTDDKDVEIDTLNTILSSLLLSSELKGYIASPAWYLQENAKSRNALDLLMMTHGWRRYNIPEVLKGNYEYPEKEFEEAKEISGTVRSLFLQKPVIGGEISILSFDGAFGAAQTDSAGRFGFYGLDYPDSTNFFIQAINQKGNKRVELLLNEETFPELKHFRDNFSLTGSESLTDEGADDVKDEFIRKAGQRAQYDEDIRLINLDEVEVTAKRIEKKDEARLQYWANAASDATIYREQIERRNPAYVSDMLFSVAGVRVDANGGISIRDGGRPLVIIDGMYMEWPQEMSSRYDSPLEMVSVHDVESIDVFKGPSAALFGVRGGNGVISITTRIGDSSGGAEKTSFNYVSINPIGYQKPVEFYSPKYDTPAAKNLSNPDYRTTIFWKPDIVVPEDGKASFEFYTSDFTTTYSVVIEGLSSDGKMIREVRKIEVK